MLSCSILLYYLQLDTHESDSICTSAVLVYTWSMFQGPHNALHSFGSQIGDINFMQWHGENIALVLDLILQFSMEKGE